MTRPLLSLIRRQRAKSVATDKLSDPELLLHLVASLTIADDTPKDKIAMTRTLAVLFRPGPDCSGAVELLREANAGEFDLEDLNALRRNPTFAEVKDLLDTIRCKENDHHLNEKLYHCIRSLAIEVGQRSLIGLDLVS